MGLNSSSGGNKTFVSIVGGQLTTRVTEDTPGAVARQLTKGPNEGQTVYELKFKSLTGALIKIEYVTKKFGSYIEATVLDGKEFILQISWEDFNVRGSFVKRLPNVDPTQLVEFCAWKDKEGHTAFIVKQNDEIVPMAFTKDNPNGMPDAVKDKLGKWDFRDQETFMFDTLEQCGSKFDGSAVVSTAKEIFNSEPVAVIQADDGAPF